MSKARDLWIGYINGKPMRIFDSSKYLIPEDLAVRFIEATPRVLAADEMYEALKEREQHAEYLKRKVDEHFQQDWYPNMQADAEALKLSASAASLTFKERDALAKAQPVQRGSDG